MRPISFTPSRTLSEVKARGGQYGPESRLHFTPCALEATWQVHMHYARNCIQDHEIGGARVAVERKRGRAVFKKQIASRETLESPIGHFEEFVAMCQAVG